MVTYKTSGGGLINTDILQACLDDAKCSERARHLDKSKYKQEMINELQALVANANDLIAHLQAGTTPLTMQQINDIID